MNKLDLRYEVLLRHQWAFLLFLSFLPLQGLPIVLEIEFDFARLKAMNRSKSKNAVLAKDSPHLMTFQVKVHQMPFVLDLKGKAAVLIHMFQSF